MEGARSSCSGSTPQFHYPTFPLPGGASKVGEESPGDKKVPSAQKVSLGSAQNSWDTKTTFPPTVAAVVHGL